MGNKVTNYKQIMNSLTEERLAELMSNYVRADHFCFGCKINAINGCKVKAESSANRVGQCFENHLKWLRSEAEKTV